MTAGRPFALLMAGAGTAMMLLVPASPLAVPRPSAATAATPVADPSPLSTGGRPRTDPVGLSWLVRACHASAALPFSGVQRVRVEAAGGERTSTVDVAHQPGSGVRLTVRGSGGRPATTYVGQLAGPSLLPTVDGAALARISSRYRVTGPTAGPRVAGRDTEVVELRRTVGPSAGSVAVRFWLDRQTSLPLQREVLDGGGRLQQASTYVSIAYRRPATIPRVTAVVGSPTDLGEGVTSGQLDGFRRTGWLAPEQLPGGFDLVDARVHGTDARVHSTDARVHRTVSDPDRTPSTVLQLAYTDGISVVSLFEQRGRLDAGPLTGWDRQRRAHGVVYTDRGTPRRMVWSAEGSVYTLVSDDPGVAEAVMSALPAPTSPPGLLGRLRHGVGRLVSWLNPFG